MLIEKRQKGFALKKDGGQRGPRIVKTSLKGFEGEGLEEKKKNLFGKGFNIRRRVPFKMV